MRSNLVDLTVTIHAESAKAVLVSDTGDRDDAVWLPKSQMEFEPVKGGIIKLTLPEWLAMDKGFI